MKPTTSLSAFFLAVLFWCAQSVSAQDRKIAIGETAPELRIGEWIKGEAVDGFRNGHVYVVEFTATWCSPCLKAIPHLSGLAKRYADEVTVISVYSLSPFAPDPSGARYAEVVKRLVGELESDIAYAVAIDMPNGATAAKWGIQGVPHATVVGRDGRIAWQGNPMRGLDAAVEHVVRGCTGLGDMVVHGKAFESKLRNLESLVATNSMEALEGIDSLLGASPGDPHLYRLKFKALSHLHCDSANAWLAFMLADGPETLDWIAISNDAWIMPDRPDYDLAMQAKVRALLQTPPSMQLNILLSISNIYMRKSRRANNPKERMRNLQVALASCQNARHYCLRYGHENAIPTVDETIGVIRRRIAKEKSVWEPD